MIRLLIEAPQAYNLSKLAAEIRAVHPSCLAVNEVLTEKTYVAAYFEAKAPKASSLKAVVAAHDPTPEPQPPSLGEQVADLKRRVAELESETRK